MKHLVAALGLLIFSISACSKEKVSITPDPPIEIPFTGDWSRQFEAGPGNLHTVHNLIYQDRLRNTLEGSIGVANYVMIRDTFLSEDNRYIGHTPDDQYYLLFTKVLDDKSISIYKQIVEDIDQGLDLTVPPASTTINHGWNTYEKQ